MGECGCGEMDNDKVVRMGKNIMGIEIYPGCRYCDTGIIVTLNLFTRKEAKVFDLEASETFAPDEHGFSQLNFPIIGPDDLVEVIEKMAEAEGMGEDGYSLSDWMHDHGLELLQSALRLRMEKTRAEQARAGE